MIFEETARVMSVIRAWRKVERALALGDPKSASTMRSCTRPPKCIWPAGGARIPQRRHRAGKKERL